MHLPKLLLSLALALLLTACGGMRIVDSDVSTFAGSEPLPPAANLAYRFERLPSQQATPQQSDALEAIAQTALARAGLRRDDAGAQVSVQLSLKMFRDPQAPWDDPRYLEGRSIPRAVATPYGLMMRHPPLDMAFEFPYYRRELAIVIRRVSDGRVLYEVKAQHDGRWSDDANVLPAMFQAALSAFPAAPGGPRRVVVEIPR